MWPREGERLDKPALNRLTDETKVEMFGHNAQHHIWWKPNTACQHKYLIPTVKHDGGRVMICFATTGPRHLAVIKSTINSSVFHSILQSNVRPSVRQSLATIGSCNRAIIPKTPANLQQNGQKRKESGCCSGPVRVQTSTSLKCCGGTRRDTCINKSLQTSVNWSNCCEEEGAKIPPQWCERLTKSYRKQLLQVIAAVLQAI